MSQELRTRALSVDPFFNSADPLGIFESLLLRTGVETDTENARLSVRHVGDLGDLGDSTFSLSASIHSSRTDTRLLLPAPTDIFTGIDPFNPPDRGFVAGSPNLMPFEFSESERERQVGLSGALFPTRALGVRLTLSSLDHDTLGTSDLVGLSANWFFVRNAAVEVELIRTGSGSGYRAGLADTDAVAVRVLGRFYPKGFRARPSRSSGCVTKFLNRSDSQEFGQCCRGPKRYRVRYRRHAPPSIRGRTAPPRRAGGHRGKRESLPSVLARTKY